MDDEEALCRVIARTLTRAGHECAQATSVEAARRLLAEQQFELVLCDINIEHASGLDLARDVIAQLPDTSVVMVTGIDDPAAAREATEFGALGYLVKPFSPNEILIQVDGALRRRDLERASRFHLTELESKLLDRAVSLHQAFERAEEAERQAADATREIVDRLTLALTIKSEETGQHIERVGLLAARLAEKAGIDAFTPEEIRLAAMLHDVGKIAVPDTVLMKPGTLTDEERAAVRRHSEIGHRLLEASTSPALQLAASVAKTHHEWWDGTGYPQGAAGESIPLEGRITAIADAFDSLTSERVYRPAFTTEEAMRMMAAERGTHFDPVLLDHFLDDAARVREIRERLPDAQPSLRPIRVLVVDDHVMFLESIVTLLNQAEGLVVVGVARSVDEAITRARETRPAVVVSNWVLDDGTAAQVAEWCKRELEDVEIVVLTDRAEDDVLLTALDAGCAGCVGKQRAFDDLVTAIRAAAAGEPLVPPAQLTSLLRRLRPRGPAGATVPTKRELEVLELMADGLSTDAIAERLCVSTHTIRNHAQRVIAKLGAHSRLEAVAAGIRAGLIRRH